MLGSARCGDVRSCKVGYVETNTMMVVGEVRLLAIVQSKNQCSHVRRGGVWYGTVRSCMVVFCHV